MGPHIRRRRNRYPDRSHTAIIEYSTFWSFRNHKNDIPSEDILVTGYEEYQKQSQGLHSMPSVR